MSKGNVTLRELDPNGFLSVTGRDGALQYELARFFLRNPEKPREISAKMDNIYAYIQTHDAVDTYETYANAAQPRRLAAAKALEKANVIEKEGVVYTLLNPERAARFVELYKRQ